MNRVILIGNLGANAELRATPAGGHVANLSLATTKRWKDKEGKKQEKTEWHRVVFFGKAAETLGDYAEKGTKLAVEGELQTRKWKDKDGVEHYTTEIIGESFEFLGGNSKKGNTTSDDTPAPASAEPGQGFNPFEDPDF